jgi:hypothetical protein
LETGNDPEEKDRPDEKNDPEGRRRLVRRSESEVRSFYREWLE